MNHYVYLLQHKDKDMNYIGVRSCGCKIGDDPYIGSSRHMTKEDKDSCNKIILKRFGTRKDAVAYEIRLHNEFDVAVASNFWNKAKQTSTGFDTTGTILTEGHKKKISTRHKEWLASNVHPCKGKNLTKEHRRKLSEAGKGRKKSEEHKRKIGLAHKGKVVKESSKLYGKDNPSYGKSVSEETRNKISKAGTKFPDPYWWVHKDTGERLFKTCLEMGKLYDPYKQSSSFTKIVKGGKLKSIYKWTLIKEL